MEQYGWPRQVHILRKTGTILQNQKFVRATHDNGQD